MTWNNGDRGKTITDYITFLSWFGGHSTSETPGSIPNPAVKHCCADGTAS